MSKREHEVRENVNREKESSSGFLLGAIVGGVLGACAALLFAPKPGRELRQTLGSQAGSIADKTSPLRESVKSKTISLSQGLAQQSSGLLNKVTGKSGREESTEDTSSAYISLQGPAESKSSLGKDPTNSDDVRKKLAEAQKAFEDEESRVKI